MPFTASSSWTWVGHPGFGSAHTDSVALLRLGFPAAPGLRPLTLPVCTTRRTVLQKVRRRAHTALRQFVNTGFQVLFHSPPGVLFTFPSQYYALSVTKEYLALRGGPRSFHQGSTCLDVLWILPCQLLFTYGAFTLYGWLSQNHSVKVAESILQSEPHGARTMVWALPRSLAATYGIDVSFSSSGYLDVSVHRVPLHTLWIGVWIHAVCACGFPHSEICGSRDICSSPQLIAAYHVFLRLLVPRHPPCALSCLTSSNTLSP